HCNLSPSDISKLKIRFNSIKNQYDNFHEKQFALENGQPKPRYKTVWPSLEVLTERITNTLSDTIIVIYYSDFLELHDPPSPIDGRFLFAKSEGDNNQMVCDFKAINQACSMVENKEEGILMKQLSKLKKKLEGTIGRKHIEVLFVECDSFKEVKYDVRSGDEIHDKFDYWKKVFK